MTVGKRVWYLRPRGRPGEKLETYWIGPCRVAERKGEHSYVIGLESARLQEPHHSQPKEHFDDLWSCKPLKMFHCRQAVQDNGTAADDWEVERIEGHRPGDDGYPEFCVKWVNFEERTWEPLRNFFHRNNMLLLAYCDKKKVQVPDVLGYLYRHQSDAAVNNITWDEAPQDWEWLEQDEETAEDDEPSGDQDDDGEQQGEDHPAANPINPMGFHGVLRAALSERKQPTERRQGESSQVRSRASQTHVVRPRGEPQ
jgi:hypothetical protein